MGKSEERNPHSELAGLSLQKVSMNPVKKDYKQYRSLPLYIILFCGITLILIGIYFHLTNTSAEGIAIEGGRYGPRRGTHIFLGSRGTIFIGVVISMFPAYVLIMKKINKRA